MSIKDRAISLLGQGFSNSMVASAIGVTPAYITQLLDEPAIFEEVSRLRAAKLEAAGEIDTQLDTLEKQALDVVKQKLPFVRNPMDAARIFSTLNSAKRKLVTNPADAGAGVNTVTLIFPKSVESGGTINIQLNSNNQVVEVEGRSMAPLPSRALATLNRKPDPALPAPETTGITRQQFTDVIAKQQAKRDIARAAKVLENISTPISITIDGVECVL